MVSLYNRFDNVVAATEKDSEPVKVPLGKLVLKSERTLQLDMDSGSSFGIGEDVHSFAADENGVWYVTCRDYLRGNPWVYCVFFKDSNIAVKGIIESDGSYLFLDGRSVLCMDKEGGVKKMCSILSAERLLGCEGLSRPVTLSVINRYISYLNEDEKENTDIYSDIIAIHRSVDRIAYSNNPEYLSVSDMAKAVIDILAFADKSGVDLQPEIIRILKREINSKKGGFFENTSESAETASEKGDEALFESLFPDGMK